MQYFYHDPLQDVYDDLAKNKTPSHFDQVLQLKGKAQDDFTYTAEKFYYKKFQNFETTLQSPKPNMK